MGRELCVDRIVVGVRSGWAVGGDWGRCIGRKIVCQVELAAKPRDLDKNELLGDGPGDMSSFSYYDTLVDLPECTPQSEVRGRPR